MKKGLIAGSSGLGTSTATRAETRTKETGRKTAKRWEESKQEPSGKDGHVLGLFSIESKLC